MAIISKLLQIESFVSSRGIRRSGTGLLAIIVLTIGGISIAAGDYVQPVAFARQETATPAQTPTPIEGLHPATTVTATPGAPLPPPGSAIYFSIALLVLLFAGALAGILALAFRRPGAWNSKNLRHFSRGVLGWFLVNTLLWLWVNDSVAHSSGTLFINPVVAVPPLVNIVALLVLLASRRWIVMLGAFSAIMVNAIGTMLATPVTVTYQENVIGAIIFNVPFFLPPFLLALNIRPVGL
jgi:hypothetical protein